MQRILSKPNWSLGVALVAAAFLAVGAAVGGAALLARVAGAQTPPAPGTPPAMRVRIACGEVLGTEAVFVGRSEFAAQLARALGKAQADVERALEQVKSQVPPPEPVAIAAHPVADDHLTSIAARLGVTAKELADAMIAAEPPCPSQAPVGEPGAGFNVLLEPSALFEAIAQKLGRGITGAQVRAAFEAEHGGPAGAQVHRVAVRSVPMEEHLEALAKALGVTTAQIKAAMESIAPVLPAAQSAGR